MLSEVSLLNKKIIIAKTTVQKIYKVVHPMMKVVSRERSSRRATEALRTVPPSVASVAEILSQQVGGVEAEH